MAKYNGSDYDQMVMFFISLEDQLSPGTLEFAIHTLVETRMDLSVFDEVATIIQGARAILEKQTFANSARARE